MVRGVHFLESIHSAVAERSRLEILMTSLSRLWPLSELSELFWVGSGCFGSSCGSCNTE